MNDPEICTSTILPHSLSKKANEVITPSEKSNRIDFIALINGLQENIVIIDEQEKNVFWCSSIFISQFPHLVPGTSLAKMMQVFDGLSECFIDTTNDVSGYPTGKKKYTVCYDSNQYFSIDAVKLDKRMTALKLNNVAEHARLMQRHLEDREKLLFTSRAISVSEMATIIAHELNQPMGTISNLLHGISLRMRREGDEKPEIIAALESAINQSQFASKIISRVREYTRSFRPQRRELDFSQLIDASISMLDWEIQREGITVTQKNLNKAPLIVLGDEVMLQQVLINLLRNSIDAMRSVAEGDKRIKVRLKLFEEQIEASISDTGCGFTAENEKNIFVPFVSTKPCGMGVGLNICRSFIELHQGKLWMTNNAHVGCTFHIALPVLRTRNKNA